MISPCKDCPNRCEGCHAYCEDYLIWKEYEADEKEAARKQRNLDEYFAKSSVRRKTRYFNWRHKP